MRLVIFGPPGAGKGTQAERIASAWSIPHVSTGGMLRDSVASGTRLGEEIRSTLAAGNLVPDELMADIIGERLAMSDAANGFLLDGYPRTVPQITTLDGLLGDDELSRVISLKVPDSELTGRLTRRASVGDGGQRRDDDNEETIRNRLAVYKKQTAPVAGVYRDRGLLAEIDGVGSVDEVFARISDVLGEIR